MLVFVSKVFKQFKTFFNVLESIPLCVYATALCCTEAGELGCSHRSRMWAPTHIPT